MRVTVASSIAFISAVAITSSAHGDDCKSAPCAPPTALTDYYQGLIARPASDPLTPWTPPTALVDQDTQPPLPFSTQATDAGISVRTGLSVWNSYNAKLIEQKADAVKASAARGVMLPKAPTVRPPAFDVWSKIDTQTAPMNDAQTLRATVGADYKISTRTKVGVTAERSDVEARSGVAALQGDEKVSAYVAFKAAPMLSVDAKSEWQKTDAVAGSASSETEKLSVAPKINHMFEIGEGNTLEPYATVKHEIDIGAAASAKDATSNSAGVGVTLAKPNSYSMTLSTDVDAVGGTEPANINSKLQFKLPLP